MKNYTITEKCKSLLLSSNTEERYGYKIEDLSHGSTRSILHKCDVCGQVKKSIFKLFLREKGLSHRKCSQTKKRDSYLKKYGVVHISQSAEIQEKKRQTCLKRYGTDNVSKALEVREKRAHTILKRYGVDNAMHCPALKEKIKQTCLTKYGVEYAGQSPIIQEKRKQTILEKYGVENAQQSFIIQEKTQQTNLVRYGVLYPQQSCVIRDKTKQVFLQKYGVEYPSQSLEVQEKMRQTNLKRYGVEYAIRAPEIQKRVKQTILDKYGVPSPAQSPKVCDKIKQTNLDRYGVEWYTSLPIMHEKAKQTNLQHFGVEHPYQLPENRYRLQEWMINNPGKCFVSKPELEMLAWIQTLYPNAHKHKEKQQEIDIFIPEINLGIEHNGLYYHQAEVLDKRHGEGTGRYYHLNKTKYFEKKNIRIIHIFEHEWKNRQEQVKSFLLSAIGKNEHKVGARKCTLQWSSVSEDIKEIHKFLEDYHIQGQPINTKYAVKVLYNNELLAVAAFGKHHRNNKDWVLTRFCTKTNYTIQGILSKISKLASQHLKEDIISWADYRLSQGNGYGKAGWIFEKLLPPDYFYSKSNKVFSKQSRQKKIVNTPAGITEKEHAKQEGLGQIYDCGKMKFRYICV